jgi:membrane protein DedA with SNARE-associated domain
MDVLQIMGKIEAIYVSYGYLLVFLSSLIEISPAGWLIPGGLLVALGGFYAFSGSVSLYAILVSGFFGVLVSFILAYFLGKKTGYLLVKKLKQEKNAQKAKLLLKKHGPAILTTSLMANLTRFWVAYIAGAQNYNFLKFIFYSSVASLTWSSLLIIAGYLAGSGRGALESWITKLGILAWGLLFLAIFIIYKKSKIEFEESQKEE